MNEKYESIIGLKYDGVKSRERMSRVQRAAQFAPFAALTGFDAQIGETNRITEDETIFSEDDAREIDDALNLLKTTIANGKIPTAKIVYFVPDEKKSGGKYVTEEKQIKRINETEKYIKTADGEIIKFSSLAGVFVIED